jgi:chemotaxis protein MotA
MFILVGAVIVVASILVGYTMHGGKVAALMQYTEFIIIGGAALGSIVIGYSFSGVKAVTAACIGLLKPSPYNQNSFLELVRAMYDVFTAARVGGLLSLEKHAENPAESDIFTKYPTFVHNHHAVDLFADTLKIVIMGGVSVYDLSEMMEMDLEVRHEDATQVTKILNTVADSMPGFGIVAAVLGVVITMQAIGGPPEEVGEKVGAALVGTFLGVLLAYGVFAPLAKATEKIATNEAQYMACIKNALVAFARGDAPLVCVEFARRNIDPELRPSFTAMEDACKQRNRQGGAEETAQAA